MSTPNLITRIALAFCLSFPLLFIANYASAGDKLMISKPWVRFAPPNAKVHAAYMTLTNKAAGQRILVGAESPVYDRVELHKSMMKDGIATMEKIETIPLAAGQAINFAPGGLHFMLIGPKEKQSLGAKVPLTLIFKSGARIAVEAAVAKTAGKSMPMDHSNH